MVVLLIVMGIGAVWMAASLPAWKQQATREKEAELVFRGRQYVRALSLWERKNGPGTRPASIDMMVDNKVLRRKYKDPITGEDFVPLYQGAAANPGQPGGTPNPPGQQGRAGGGGQAGSQGSTFGGQIYGVQSKSTASSIMLLNGKSRYNEWEFFYVGGRAGGPQGPGRGNPPTNPGIGTGNPPNGRGNPVPPPPNGRGNPVPPPNGRGRGGF